MSTIVFPTSPNEGDIFQASNGFRYIYRNGAWDAFTFNVNESAFNDTDDLVEGTTNLYFTPERVAGTLVGTLITGLTGDLEPTDTLRLGINRLQGELSAHEEDGANPHATTAAQVGAPALDGTGATGNWGINVTGNAGTADKLKTSVTINGTPFDGSQDIIVGAADATERIAVSEKGAANGVATLDAGGKIPAIQLPSFVDDVLEYASFGAFPVTGESSKIYIDTSNNKTYRWSGSQYMEIASSPGSTDAIAEGSVNLYFTAARAQAAVVNISGSAGSATVASKVTLVAAEW